MALYRLSKYKNVFPKGFVPNFSEEIFVNKKVKNTVPWTYLIRDIKGEEIVQTLKIIAKNKSKRV